LPLFYGRKSKKDTLFFVPVDFKKYNQQCRFVFAKKKTTSIIDDYDKDYFTQENTSIAFLENTTLEKRAKSIGTVIEYLAKQKWVSDIYVVGHSEGYRVAASVAAKSKKIKKVVCMSANPFNRCLQFRMEERIKGFQGLVNDTIVNQNVDSLHNFFWNLPQFNFGDSMRYEMAFFKNELSYNYNFSIFDLLKIKIPILITYGTSDIGSLDNDLVPYFFTEKKKTNLSVKTYPNLEHNYLLLDKDGSIKEKHWNDVFKDVIDWLFEKEK
jgi:pimeloyl-ACP methyl ester carboxylesterase